MMMAFGIEGIDFNDTQKYFGIVVQMIERNKTTVTKTPVEL